MPEQTTPCGHIDRHATVPLSGASAALRRALREQDVDLRRVTDQRLEGDTLYVFHTMPYDHTTYMATVHLGDLPPIPQGTP